MDMLALLRQHRKVMLSQTERGAHDRQHPAHCSAGESEPTHHDTAARKVFYKGKLRQDP